MSLFFKLPMADTQLLYHRKCPQTNFGSCESEQCVLHQALGKKGVHQAGNTITIIGKIFMLCIVVVNQAASHALSCPELGALLFFSVPSQNWPWDTFYGQDGT